MSTSPNIALFTRLIDHLDVAVALIECPCRNLEDSQVLYVNRALGNKTGYTREAFGAAFQAFLLDPANDTHALEAIREAFSNCQATRQEVRFRRNDGSSFWAEVEIMHLDAGTNTCALLIRDISRRRQALESQQVHRDKLAVTLGSIGEGVISTDVHGAVDYVNREGERLIGMRAEEVAGQPLQEVFPLAESTDKSPASLPLEQVFRSAESAGPVNDKLLLTRDGIERKINFQLSPILDPRGRITGTVLVFTDISDQVRLEGELQKNQRMESIALLSGGIAHDFNNMLTGILGNISLARNCCNPQDQVFNILKSAEKAAVRARDLTHQLLTFSKGGVPIKTRTSLRNLIRESSGFILSGSNCRCQLRVPEDLWPVEVDEGQISQVINNLLINAAQAMKKGGRIEIAAENIELGAVPSIPLAPGFYIKIVVADNGPGITPDILARIFDPYFTTKKSGSGLGLATSYSIVKNHDGHIMVDSELGEGTTFTFYLPAIPSAVVYTEETETRLYHGKGRLLLMDDEKMVRQIAGDMLTHLGYEVSFAEDGEEAIRLFEEAEAADNGFDALILDLTVPGNLGGLDVVERLLPGYPELRAVVSSGYTNNPVLQNPAEYGFCANIQKPYTIQQLSWVVRSVIQQSVAK